MVVRYILRCDNCGATTMLRIRAGYGDREPFAFDCPRCSQPISGAMLLDPHAFKILGLGDLAGATQTNDSHQRADYEHRHDNWFLVDASKAGEPDAFSAFLQATGRHGIDLFGHLQKQATLESVIKQAKAIQRTLRNYELEQWEHFRSGAAELSGGLPDNTPEAQLDAVMDILDTVFEPLIDETQDQSLWTDYVQFVDDLNDSHEAGFRNLLSLIRDRGYAAAIHKDAIQIAIRWLPFCTLFRPLIAEREPTRPDERLSASLRMGSVEQLHGVKALYVDVYEAICRGLTVIMALINLAERSDYDHFPPHPDNRFKKFHPASLSEFHKASHAPKISLVRAHPVFNRWLGNALDSSLRNAIGHNALDIDRDRQTISYPQRLNQTTITTTTYASFLATILHALVCAHQLHWFNRIVMDNMRALLT